MLIDSSIQPSAKSGCSLPIGLEMAEMRRNVTFQQIFLAVCHLILVMVCSFVQQTLMNLFAKHSFFEQMLLECPSAQGLALARDAAGNEVDSPPS